MTENSNGAPMASRVDGFCQSEGAAPTERNAYRIAEFCASLGISQATFFKYQAAGKIKTIQIGRRRLVPAAEARRIASEGLQ